LLADNLKLKEKNLELETRMLSFDTLQKENEELKALFSLKKDGDYILGYVVSRPPQSPYDILIIDAGSNNGIKEGAEVTAYGSVLLGYVSEVFPKSAKIKLISFSGDEMNAIFPIANLPVTVIGRGGGNLETKLQGSIEIKSGDQITTMGAFPLELGVVERIERGLSDPFQKIIFRLPVNIQELKYVMVRKNVENKTEKKDEVKK